MRFKLLFCLWAITCVSQALAVHTRLDTVGKTYPLAEPNLTQELKEQAAQIDTQALLTNVDQYQPANLHPLPRAANDRLFPVDLTYSLDQDVRDSQGNLLYPQGFTFNPLQYASLTGGLVIIDGSDPKQVGWFKASPYFQNHQAILLLSGGSAAQLQRELQRPVYYLTHDIAARLQLKAAPSVVIEQDQKLTVREVQCASHP